MPREGFHAGQMRIRRRYSIAPPIPRRARDTFREPVISQVEFLLPTQSGNSRSRD